MMLLISNFKIKFFVNLTQIGWAVTRYTITYWLLEWLIFLNLIRTFYSTGFRWGLLSLLGAWPSIESFVKMVVQFNLRVMESLVVLSFHHLGINLLLENAFHCDAVVLNLRRLSEFGFISSSLLDLNTIGLLVNNWTDVFIFREGHSALGNQIGNVAHFFLWGSPLE